MPVAGSAGAVTELFADCLQEIPGCRGHQRLERNGQTPGALVEPLSGRFGIRHQRTQCQAGRCDDIDNFLESFLDSWVSDLTWNAQGMRQVGGADEDHIYPLHLDNLG